MSHQQNDIGVTITSDLKWSAHIQNICQKPNRTNGFLKRNLNIVNSDIKVKAYTALVRPTVEYARSVWDPHFQKDKLEMIHMRSAMYVTNRYHNNSSVETMLQKLQWPTLEERRKKDRLTLRYKVANGEVDIDAGNKLLPPDRLSRHTNAHYFQISSCKTSIRKESYYPTTIRDWNNLPAPVAAV